MRRVAAVLVFVVAATVGLSFVGVLPVRSYLTQQQEIRDTAHRLAQLESRNAALTELTRRLRSNAEVERLAREMFGMVRPGDEAYAIPGLRESDDLLAAPPQVRPALPIPADPGSRSAWRRAFDLVTFWS